MVWVFLEEKVNTNQYKDVLSDHVHRMMIHFF